MSGTFQSSQISKKILEKKIQEKGNRCFCSIKRLRLGRECDAIAKRLKHSSMCAVHSEEGQQSNHESIKFMCSCLPFTGTMDSISARNVPAFIYYILIVLVRFQKNERQILRAPLLLHLLTSSATSTTFQGDWESGLFVLSRLILLSNPCLSLIFTKKDAALDWKLAVETSLITTTYDKDCGYFILRVCP